jgi:S-DNA-T family DNA segregation ATPase FtsK/SpoIIIE
LSDLEPAGDQTPVLEGRVVRPAPARVVQRVRVVVKHERTRTAGRHAAYVGIGTAVVVKRLWDSRSSGRYERAWRTAETSGDREAALEWEKRLAAFRRDRHQRRMDMIAFPFHALATIAKITAGLFGALIVMGILLAVADHKATDIDAPLLVVANIVKWVWIIASVAWAWALTATVCVALAGLWHVGRNHATGGGGWTVAGKQDEQDLGLVVTADTIVLALQHLRIAELKKAFKDGWVPTFDLQPVRDGRGYSAVFRLPLGVTAEMIADQRAVLARNVHRAEVEVWPSDAEKAGVGPAGSVSVWIADPGVLSKPAPEYPLLHEGTADVFEGVPGGVSPRGDAMTVPVVANNMVVGGMMGQGKSNACRVFMLGCALDPLAELDVFVFANNGDFDAYRPRLAVYERGVEDDTIVAAVNRLHELYAEVARRENRIAELGAKKVTRALAAAHPDLRPIIVLFSECHELFGHAEYGEVAAELSTKTAKRARKTAVVLVFDTQSSRKEAIPPKLVELVSVNGCFYVKTWRSNDGFLGDGSFAAGIRATELRPGRDRGTSLITGVSDQQFELLKWYFVEVDDDTGFDAATDVIARAMTKVAPGTPIEATAPRPAIEAEVRDLLADLAEVLRGDEERVRLSDLPPLLRDLAPGYEPYMALSMNGLWELLEAEGVRVLNPQNKTQLDPADLRAALAGRAGEVATVHPIRPTGPPGEPWTTPPNPGN